MGAGSLRFPGQYYDVEAGLYYNYLRDYEPSSGRYVESDPIGLDGGISSFAYAGSNPLKLKDLYGMSACEDKPCPYSGQYEVCCQGYSPRGTWLANWLRYRACKWGVGTSCNYGKPVCCTVEFKKCNGGGSPGEDDGTSTYVPCMTSYITCMAAGNSSG